MIISNPTKKSEANCKFLVQRFLLVMFVIFGLYVLTAPFVFPFVFHTRVGYMFYRPIALSLERKWFGRNVMWWYCFDVCRMKIVLPIEVDSEGNL